MMNKFLRNGGEEGEAHRHWKRKREREKNTYLSFLKEKLASRKIDREESQGEKKVVIINFIIVNVGFLGDVLFSEGPGSSRKTPQSGSKTPETEEADDEKRSEAEN
ncbi:hypothetical protein RUM43_003920 [Polyplax serrata]|uniref:Uncharacterized protein n=1 Tax=Polyplax serrata TaxID=468196 RepID=A0AAN8S653_POLSC